MANDELAELALIEVSRMQREAIDAIELERETALAQLQEIADEEGWEA